MEQKNFKQYLPSPEFRKKAIIIIVLLFIVFLIAEVVPSVRENLKERRLEKTLLVKDLVTQDQNKNGIQDWEEALWGLDPNADGASNKEYILAKKNLLNKDGIPDSELTENDKMSREFFALVVSLQQSGNLNNESMKVLANDVSKGVTSNEIADIYTDKMIKTENTTPATLRRYYTDLQKISKAYQNKGIGEELALIGQAIANNDHQALRLAILTATDYRNFGIDLMNISVPTSLVTLHLELANNNEKTAISLEGMSIMLDNPVGGIASFIKYKKYNDSLVATLDKMTSFFKRNGIIK